MYDIIYDNQCMTIYDNTQLYMNFEMQNVF